MTGLLLEKLKLLCSEHIRLKKGSAVIYMDSKTVSLDSETLSFDEAVKKLTKELNADALKSLRDAGIQIKFI